MPPRPRVTVLGSLNMDISVTVPRLPEPRKVRVVCAETPVEVIVATLARHSVSILNLAPAPADAAAIVAGARPDWLVVNETEAGAVLGEPVSGLAEAAQAAVALVGR